MDFRGARRPGRVVVLLVILAGAALGGLGMFNVAGWRARVVARFLRTENQPRVVARKRPVIPVDWGINWPNRVRECTNLLDEPVKQDGGLPDKLVLNNVKHMDLPLSTSAPENERVSRPPD
jgi:hypothetical protein